MEDILTEEDKLSKEDRVKFYELSQKHGINNIIPSVKVIKSIEFLEQFDPRILREISRELIDAKFPGVTHGKRSTYSNLKCRGKLCRYINTLEQRQRRGIDGDMYTGTDEALIALIAGHIRGME